MKCKLLFELRDGSVPSSVTLIDQGAVTTIDPRRDSYWYDPAPGRLLTCAPPYGHWDVAVDTRYASRVSKIIFDPITVPPGPSWWHALHGVGAVGGSAPVRIGVIDEALALQMAASCVRHVKNLGGLAWGSPNSPRAFNPLTDHGQAVCSLLGSRAGPPAGFSGVAPDAEVFFAAAPRDNEAVLELDRVVACIDMLVDQYQCDIISVSAGDQEDPTVTLQLQIEEAADKGTLCFFAAGNLTTPLYPALYPLSLSVAALGMSASAPTESLVGLHNDKMSEPLTGNHFLWKSSARGPDIKFCSAGVGVVWDLDGAAAKGAVGTSFACPIAAGVAARILGADPAFRGMARQRARYDYGVQRLAQKCRPFGVANEANLWRHGLLWIP